MVITMLDIDGFRFDKAAQVTVDAQGNFSAAMRDCAAKIGKKNFFLPGELTPGNTLSSSKFCSSHFTPHHPSWIGLLQEAPL